MLAVVTLGKHGAMWRCGDMTGTVPGFSVKVADTNGAGDTFFGSFLSRIAARGGLEGLTEEEINGEYEKNTGLVIIETFDERGLNPMYTPGVLCTNHGPFTWGKDAAEAVHNAVVLEEVAKMALKTELIKPDVKPAPDCIRDKHFFRKHGANAYYGQN